MASPQTEDGYVKIANELFDLVGQERFNGTQYKIIMCIIRYTYGFNRKSHGISASFIAKWGGCDVRGVKRELKKLIDMKVVKVVMGDPGCRNHLAVNKNYEEWNLGGGELSTSGELCTGGESSTESSGESSTGSSGEFSTQEITNIKTKEKQIYCPDFDSFWSVYPRHDSKRAAYRCYERQIKKGYSPEELLRAAQGYADKCEFSGTEKKYIKLAQTFLGPDAHFEDFLRDDEPEPVAGESTLQRNQGGRVLQ